MSETTHDLQVSIFCGRVLPLGDDLVGSHRQQSFDQLSDYTAKHVAAWHRSGAGAWGPMLSREDAATVSITAMARKENEVAIQYQDYHHDTCEDYRWKLRS